MKFTERELDNFIALYKQEFGDNLTRNQAQQKATSLVSIVKLTYVPMTKKEFEENMKACRKQQKCYNNVET